MATFLFNGNLCLVLEKKTFDFYCRNLEIALKKKKLLYYYFNTFCVHSNLFLTVCLLIILLFLSQMDKQLYGRTDLRTKRFIETAVLFQIKMLTFLYFLLLFLSCPGPPLKLNRCSCAAGSALVGGTRLLLSDG